MGLAVGGGTADEGAVSWGASQSHWLGFWGFVLISRLRGTIKVKKEIIGIKMTGVHPSLSAPHGLSPPHSPGVPYFTAEEMNPEQRNDTPSCSLGRGSKAWQPASSACLSRMLKGHRGWVGREVLFYGRRAAFGQGHPPRSQSLWRSKANSEIKSIFSFRTDLCFSILRSPYRNKVL